MIYIIGIGPGYSSDYLSVRAYKTILKCDLGIYVGEMIGPEIKKIFGGRLIVMKSLKPEKIKKIISEYYREMKSIALLEPGDSSLYSGQISEQLSVSDYVKWFEENKFEYEIIPGISSWNAVCARLGIENVTYHTTQDILLTSFERLADTGNFSRSKLNKYFENNPNLVLFQSFSKRKEIFELVKKHYPPSTPVIFAYKFSWPDEIIIRTTIAKALYDIRNKQIHKHTIILIGDSYGKIH